MESNDSTVVLGVLIEALFRSSHAGPFFGGYLKARVTVYAPAAGAGALVHDVSTPLVLEGLSTVGPVPLDTLLELRTDFALLRELCFIVLKGVSLSSRIPAANAPSCPARFMP